MHLKIREHRLDKTSAKVISAPTLNQNSQREIDPKHIIIHYTAGRSFESSVNWLTNPKSKASAHIIVGREGEIAQLVDFNRRAWHAGRSIWDGKPDLNSRSIGIELDNAGKLNRRADGYYTWFGRRVPDSDVVIVDGSLWHAFTDAQIETAYTICEAIIDEYPTIGEDPEGGVLGHNDIAPGRKVDPGPAFPMNKFRSWLYGRGEG